MLQIWLPLNGHLNNQGLNSANGTWIGTSSYYNNGKIGKCVSCNSSHYVICPYNFQSTNKFSQTFWIYIPSTLGNCGQWETVQMIPGYSMSWTDYNKLKIYGENNQLWWLPADIFYDKWVHLAIIHTGTKILLYINGVIYGEATSNSSAISSGTIYLGNGIDTTYGPVKFCDYRLYDSALSSKEIHEIAKGLVLHYPFNDEYVGSIVYDCSGYCNNGTVTGSLQVVDDSPRYKKSTKITTSNTIKTTVPILNNIYSFSWWYNKANFGAGDMMWGYGDGNRINPLYSLCFNIGDGTDSPWYIPGTTTKITAPSGNTWHHFVITGDGSTSKLYVDGILYGICINFKPITGSILHINGWSSGGDYRTNGNISDFRIYSTTLSEDDIKELYNTSAIINNNNTLSAYEFVE